GTGGAEPRGSAKAARACGALSLCLQHEPGPPGVAGSPDWAGLGAPRAAPPQADRSGGLAQLRMALPLAPLSQRTPHISRANRLGSQRGLQPRRQAAGLNQLEVVG